jgi:hypothetical protein
MSMKAQEAYDEILAQIQKQGGEFSTWYCGITQNINNRLHGDHKVPEKGHWFIYRKCVSDEAARAVEMLSMSMLILKRRLPSLNSCNS